MSFFTPRQREPARLRGPDLRLGALVVLAAALTVTGCERRQPNVVLISIDTLRADRLGCYGYERPTSPGLDRLASQGVLFEQAIANSPWTLPSHASMFTGLFPRSHGMKDFDSGLRDGIPTLATVLLEHGYQTMALVNSQNLSERYGLVRGFERYRRFRAKVDGERYRSGAEQVDQARAWIEEASEPFFLLLHNYDVHSEYAPDPEFLERFERPYDGHFTPTSTELKKVLAGAVTLTEADERNVIDRYDAGILQLDSDLSRLFDHLDSSGLTANTIVIVTSDHGEEFFEHGGVLHGRTMYREIVDIPLIVRGPGVPAGRRISGLVQLTDIFPTVLDLLGLEAPKVDGISLVPAWSGGGLALDQRPAFAEADHHNVETDVVRMVRVGDVKLIHNRLTDEYELYDLGRDPRESTNIAKDDPATLQALADHLERYFAGARDAVELPPLSKEDLENLRSLGYLE